FQLALHAGGFPLPRPCLAAGGRAVIVGPGGAGYRVYEWVDLDPGGRVDRATAGGLLARIHGLAWPADHVHPWFHRPVADDRWPALLDAARAAGAPWHDVLAGRVGEILATTARVAPGPPTGVVRCHLDFNAENVLTGTDGRPWVIDWENSGGADPAQELVQVVHELAGDDDRAARALLDGYRAAGGAVGPVLAAGLAAFSLAWAVQANLIALYAERALDAGRRPVDRDRSARWLPTILDHLLTVARAERILDLCAAR
ncbi:MAG TPA: phosphotransferase, partial [Acidimicrobiales bacterium]